QSRSLPPPLLSAATTTTTTNPPLGGNLGFFPPFFQPRRRRCCCKKNWPQNANVTAANAANTATFPSPIGIPVFAPRLGVQRLVRLPWGT
ncbi:MAG: hypothetical protein J0L63_12370, partial [Anaerolineae bacterium]|nr:hypothetical protein [Anaerolineae bacterium]